MKAFWPQQHGTLRPIITQQGSVYIRSEQPFWLSRQFASWRPCWENTLGSRCRAACPVPWLELIKISGPLSWPANNSNRIIDVMRGRGMFMMPTAQWTKMLNCADAIAWALLSILNSNLSFNIIIIILLLLLLLLLLGLLLIFVLLCSSETLLEFHFISFN